MLKPHWLTECHNKPLTVSNLPHIRYKVLINHPIQERGKSVWAGMGQTYLPVQINADSSGSQSSDQLYYPGWMTIIYFPLTNTWWDVFKNKRARFPWELRQIEKKMNSQHTDSSQELHSSRCLCFPIISLGRLWARKKKKKKPNLIRQLSLWSH